MLRPDADQTNPAIQVRPCAGCDKPGLFEVWGQPSCLACAHAWDVEAPPDDAWDGKYPPDKERYAAKKVWTAKWFTKRRQVAA